MKNALFKVIKLRDASQVCARIVVQDGTLCKDGVLEALGLTSGREDASSWALPARAGWRALLPRRRSRSSRASASW
jgi:hypothetical protein